jgi:hypothetical protein
MKSIELVSPTSAGSGTDIYARALADIVQRNKLLPQAFVVHNRTGGGSLIAYNYFQTKRGDPYVMLAATGTIAFMAARADVNIGLENYTPLALFAVDPQAVMVNADLPYKTLKDLAEAARKQPDTIVCAITNPLGSGHIAIHEPGEARAGREVQVRHVQGRRRSARPDRMKSGAAAAVGKLWGFDAAMLASALGLAGSCAAGLLEFAWRGDDTKRIHLGRASSMGLESALLARKGLHGPVTVIEGPYGYFNAFSEPTDIAKLTDGLGRGGSSSPRRTRLMRPT